jgi:hypothetical protein
MLEGRIWKRCENVRNKKLLVYRYEEGRMGQLLKEARTSTVVEPVMMMMMMMI